MPFDPQTLPEIVRLTMERDRLLIRHLKIHNRILWCSLTGVFLVNLILLYGIWRHIGMIH